VTAEKWMLKAKVSIKCHRDESYKIYMNETLVNPKTPKPQKCILNIIIEV